MKNSLLFIIYLSIHYSCFAQAQNYDSLLRAIETQTDTSQVLALISLGNMLGKTDLDSATATLDQAIRKATVLGYVRGQLKATQTKGIAYGRNDHYEEAILCFNETIALGETYGFHTAVSDAYSNLGVVYKRIGDYSTSYKYYNESWKIQKRKNNPGEQAHHYNNLGVLHNLMGEIEESYEYYMKAYEINDSLGREFDNRLLLSNIAIYHQEKKEYDKAIALFLDNIQYYDSSGHIRRKLRSLNNLAAVYRLREQYDSALYFADIGINQAKETLTHTWEMASLLVNRSNAYAELGELDKALEDALAENELAKRFGYAKLHDSYHLQAYVYEARGEYKKALEAQKMRLFYKDSIFEDNKVKEFKKQQVLQRVQEQTAQLNAHQENIDLLNEQVDKEKEWRIYLGVISVLLLLTIVLLYQKYTYRQRVNSILEKKNLLISQQKSEIERINQELENRMLRAQINPHFIFNALNSIQHFILQSDRESALGYLTKFSSLLRQILENSINVRVTVADELKFIRIYLELEALRFDDSFVYNIEINSDLDPEACEVPILLLQPFVENAILHALIPKEGEKILRINAMDIHEYVVFVIEDNGIGRANAAKLKAEKSFQQKSRGLSVTEQRIKILQKSNEEGLVTFEDLHDCQRQPAGTRVTIKVPKDS